MARNKERSPDCVAIGGRIKALREGRGWSRAHVATHVGVTANAIDKLEAGQNWPTVKTLLEIARVLECSVDLLLGHDRVIYTLLPAEAEALAILRRLPPDRVPLALSVLSGLEKT